MRLVMAPSIEVRWPMGWVGTGFAARPVRRDRRSPEDAGETWSEVAVRPAPDVRALAATGLPAGPPGLNRRSPRRGLGEQ